MDYFRAARDSAGTSVWLLPGHAIFLRDIIRLINENFPTLDSWGIFGLRPPLGRFRGIGLNKRQRERKAWLGGSSNCLANALIWRSSRAGSPTARSPQLRRTKRSSSWVLRLRLSPAPRLFWA